MPDIPLKNQIIIWLKEQQFWFQFVGNKLLEGELINESIVDETYKLFLEDQGLHAPVDERLPIQFNEITASSTATTSPLFWKEVSDLNNVNAIENGYAISINQNLTVIYGQNGSGKSGYVRIIRKAFKSRGDGEIIPNINNSSSSATSSSIASAKFTFSNNGISNELIFPADATKPEFSSFSVFDSDAARIYLDEEKRPIYVPSGFEFFNSAAKICQQIEERLRQEIQIKSQPHNFTNLFPVANVVRNEVENLTASSDINNFRKLVEFSADELQLIEKINLRLAEIRTLNIPARITELNNLIIALGNFQLSARLINETFMIENINRIKALVNSHIELSQLSQQEGIQNFQGKNIPLVGDDSWQSFLRSAQFYAQAIDSQRGSNLNYPTESDSCLFCLQTLGPNERELINNYWQLLRGAAQTALRNNELNITDLIRQLNQLIIFDFVEGNILTPFLRNNFPEQLNQFSSLLNAARQNMAVLIENLTNRNWERIPEVVFISQDEIDAINIQLNTIVQGLDAETIRLENERLLNDQQLYNDRNTLSRILPQIESTFANLTWASKALNSIAQLNTQSISRKQGKLYSEYVTDKYIELFQKECAFLKAPLSVSIKQRTDRGTALYQLEVSGYSPSQILSEGEQRAIALADFLTESQMNPINKGIVFDDPVNSLDHIRKENIAERIVKESQSRQVIVFTHDPVFLFNLKYYAEAKVIPFSFVAVHSIGKSVGVIISSLPWLIQNVKARLGILKSDLQVLKSKYSTTPYDVNQYERDCKQWYELLREGWERAVEERLFKGTIERFSVGVSTQKLKRIIFTSDFVKAIDDGMTESSKWIHDRAAGLNVSVPDITKMETDIKLFEDFITNCKSD